MAGVLLLIISLLGKATAQQIFDPMERPLLEVTPPLLQSSSRTFLAFDQHLMDSRGFPVKPIPENLRQLPPSPPLLSSQFSPQLFPQPPPQSTEQTVRQQMVPQSMHTAISSHLPPQRQPAEGDELPRLPFPLPFPRQPQPLNSQLKTVLAPSLLGILNQDRIHVEGFQPIDRRFAATKRKRSPVIIDKLSTSEDVKDEDFLPVDSSTRRLSALDMFDQSEAGIDNEVGSEGVRGDFQNLSRSDYISSRNLRPESGYQASATRLSNGLLKSRGKSNNNISRVQQEQSKEESNSIVDQEEGSGLGQDIDVSMDKENVIEGSLFESFLEPLKVPEENMETATVEFGTPTEPRNFNPTTLTSTNVTVSVVNQSTTVQPKLPSTRDAEGLFVPPASSNSVPFVRDSKMLRIVKEYAALIVGCILGIPAIVVLCYFLNLKRLKRYTGTLDVSPRQTVCHHKKSESRKTICSEENELACSPSTTTSKTPQPPPFPNCKKYVS